ncbi:MAG: RHS repeat-associated core domain-containing protein [Eubacterium sp.]
MKKHLKKFISVFLSVVMVITVIPATTYAMEEYENDYEFSADEVSIEYEIESKRTENSKTYMTDDGGYYQVSAAVPIHNNVNGQWEEVSEIDNNIETIADAENAINEIAAYSVSNPTETGFYESETLTLFSNGIDENPMRIAGSSQTENGIRSCIYVKPSIITDKQVFINNATLTVSTGNVNSKNNTNYIEVRRLENELTQPENAALPVYNDVILEKQIATSNNNYCKLDITSYAHYSSLGLYENTGLALEPQSANTSIEVDSIVLGIYYREIGDVDKTIESETVNLDRAGTLYVNDYTCSPLIVRNDLSVYDELAQVNVQTIINPAAIDNNSSDGVNTRTNYYSILQYENGEYYWKNCEGEYVFFTNDSNGNIFVGSNSSGDKYILTSTNDRTDYGRIKIESEKDNTTYYFSKIGSNGYVTKIEYIFTEGEGENQKQYVNKVEITYDGESILYITDGSNRKYKYNYENNLLTSISVFYIANGTEQPAKTNGTDIAVQYSYDENNRLNKVTYPDGYYVSYSYDENGRIINVTAYESDSSDNAAIDLTLNYQNGTVKSNVISKYILKTNDVVSNEVEINSPMDNIYNRVFSDILNKSEKIMHYDQDSNLIHYKDYNGQEYYLNYTNGELQHLIYEDSSSKNIIANGDFENTGSWTISEGGAASITNNAPIKENGSTNNRVMAFMANNKPENIVTQEVNVIPTKSYVLCCSAYCKQTLPFKTGNAIADNNRYFSVRVYGAVSGKLVGETYFDYNIANSWQTSKIVIDIPETISKVKIEINSLNMPGECYFDDLSMYLATPDNAPPFDDNSEIPNYEIVRNEYGQITDIIKKRSNDNKTLGKHYEYDENTHYKTSVEEAGKITYYNYDCGSGLLTSKGKNTDPSKNTQYTYSAIGALTSVQQAITTAEGTTVNQTVEYAYDDNDRISSIYHNGCLYEYTYNQNGKIENVIVKESAEENANIDYSMSYEYKLDNVNKVIFGNGASIRYIYDGDNITRTIYDNGKSGDENETYIYSYKYNSDGSVAEMTDEVSNTVTTYTSKGCTVKRNGSTIYSNTGSKINLFGTSFSYSQSSTESKDKTTTTVKDSYTVSLTKGPIVNAETVLDTFDRTMSTSVENKGNNDKNTHYKLTSSTEYVDGPDNRQTNLVSHYRTELSKRSNKILPEKYENTRISAEWSYKYDDVGRVTSIFKKSTNNIALAPTNKTSYAYDEGDLVRYYQYDEGGQISLEVNLEDLTAIRYYFNEGGNISKKTNYTNINNSDYSYNYSSNTLIFTPTKSGSTTTLEYKSNGMTDYLTSYDGRTITYDNAGNPLDYAGSGMDYSSIRGTMTWDGDLLTSFSDGGNLYKYTYDGDGKRTSKTYYQNKRDTVPTSIIEYIWDGDIITGYRARFYGDPPEDETQGSTEKVLYYDKTVKVIYNNNDIVGVCVIANEGEPAANNTSININETIKYMDWDQSANYTFVKDGQGNITEIYDPSEKVIISMSYDAYGNMKPNYIGTFVQDIKKEFDDGKTDKWWIELIRAFACALVIAMYLSGIFVSVEQGFKGYIYDIETGLYYGQKRYYSPAWGRFINASDPMTLTEDMSSVYNSNLFNYCGNDPVNNITKTGFNAPDLVISDSFVPQLVNSTNNLIKENRSTAKYFGEISTGLDTLSLGLRTTLDADAKSYWDETLNKQKDVVDNGYGFNYIQSAIDKNTSSVTKYSVDEVNTPYKASESID